MGKDCPFSWANKHVWRKMLYGWQAELKATRISRKLSNSVAHMLTTERRREHPPVPQRLWKRWWKEISWEAENSMRSFLQGKRLNWKYKSNPGIKDLPSRKFGRKRAKYNLFIFIVPSLLTLRYFRDIKLDGFKLSLCSFTATHSSCEWGISPLQQAGGVGRNPKTGRSQPCICQNFKFFLWYIVLSLLRLWVVTFVMAFIKQVPLYHRKRLEIT